MPEPGRYPHRRPPQDVHAIALGAPWFGIGKTALLAYHTPMHEMSLTVNMLDIVREEMQKHNAGKLCMVRVRYGALANVVPEALHMAFTVLTAGTDFEGAELVMTEEPVRLVCGGCRKEFEPESAHAAVFSACPLCQEEIGHTVVSGKELYIDHIAVE